MIKNINGSKDLIISHIADIDGAGSIILAKKYFNNIDYILCEVMDLIDLFKEDYSSYENVYVCDLQICEDAIKSIENNDDLKNKLRHFDHHSSMINDNIPEYANYVVELNGRKTCGTELFYNYIIDSGFNRSIFYDTLVEAIRSNDTWDKYSDFELGRKLASIHALIGPESFINMICELDDSVDFKLSETYLNMVNMDDNKMRKYISNVNSKLLKTRYNDYNIAITISEQYRSILGDEICTMNPDIDFVLIINFERNTCSLRCIKDNIDLSKICLEFHHNGGGHKKAAGFILDNESIPKIKKYIDEYLNNIK